MAAIIGDRVRRRRKEQGLTQVQLAQKARIGQPALSSIETGETLWLRGGTLLRLAAALDCDVHWLETGEGDPAPHRDLTDADLLDVWSSLSPANRRIWLDAGRGMAAGQPKRPPDTADPYSGVSRSKSTRKP